MKFLIQIFLTLYIVLFSSKLFSSELKEIVLLDGANKFQSQAISSGLSNLILEDAKYQLTKSHFPYGPHCQKNTLDCRQNFKFTAGFKTVSFDLNFDGFNEVFVNYISPSYCGSGGCTTYILQKNINNNWKIIGKFFPGYNIKISSDGNEGYSDIFFGNTRCRYRKYNNYACK